ncbi:MAG: Fe-S protein assembly co-chaperone HscB [Bryobacterales bacterium]|nr:Fe-S protein assembly co-chaperone HscB [Bryobacterales bacterium]
MASVSNSAVLIPEEIRQQLEAPNPDFYAFLGLPEQLALDPDDLQKRFYERSRLLHPDRFARANPAEREESLRASSLLNDGYRTLKDPLQRAEYVLARYGFDIGEQRSNNVPPELLEEVFELNMALDELRGGDEDARPHLVEAEERFLAMRGDCDRALGDLFSTWDTQRTREALAEIRAILNRRRYIQNLVRDVDAALAGAV